MVKIKDTQFCVKNLKMKRKKGQKIFERQTLIMSLDPNLNTGSYLFKGLGKKVCKISINLTGGQDLPSETILMGHTVQ